MNVIGLCNSCTQITAILYKYPNLAFVCDKDTVDWLKTNPSLSHTRLCTVTCEKCGKLNKIKLDSLVTQYQKNIIKNSNYCYYCHKCSKSGKLHVDVNTVLSYINLDKTVEIFGGLPKNVKKGNVFAICGSCSKESVIKLSSMLHQARRHKKNNTPCVYFCFKCGINRQDVVEKQNVSRKNQLTKGKRSGLEIATANRLTVLGIKFIEQYQIDMYVWDFFLPDFDLLIDVNGEYWHALPKNAAKDKSKLAYTQSYHSQYKCLIIEEKNFLNPMMVDHHILNIINHSPELTCIDFHFSDIKITKINEKKEYIDFLSSYHYAQSGRSGKATYGAYLGNKLVAVCKFNGVVRQNIGTSIGLSDSRVLELDRFCIHPQYQKKNFASWFISRCVKLVFYEFRKISGLVSFADSTFGHSGTIYKASNWTEIGIVKPSYDYIDPSGIIINKKRVYIIASKLGMKEAEYAQKHNLKKLKGKMKYKFVLLRSFKKI